MERVCLFLPHRNSPKTWYIFSGIKCGRICFKLVHTQLRVFRGERYDSIFRFYLSSLKLLILVMKISPFSHLQEIWWPLINSNCGKGFRLETLCMFFPQLLPPPPPPKKKKKKNFTPCSHDIFATLNVLLIKIVQGIYTLHRLTSQIKAE